MNWIKRLFEPEASSQTSNHTKSDFRRSKTHPGLSRQNGGLAEVVKRFEASGFISKVRSWVSAGPNQQINSVEVLQLFGLRSLTEMANKAGVPLDRLRISSQNSYRLRLISGLRRASFKPIRKGLLARQQPIFLLLRCAGYVTIRSGIASWPSKSSGVSPKVDAA